MSEERQNIEEHREKDRRINSVSGGVLLIWIGLALLIKIGWGTGLIGVGVVLLAEQFARRLWAVKYDTSWMVVGVAALVIGILMTVEVKISAVPIILLAIGVALVVTAFKGPRAKN